MLELKAITLKEYIELSDKSEYDFAMKFAHLFTIPENTFEIIDISLLPFGKIKDYQYDITQNMLLSEQLDYFKSVTKIKDFGKIKLDSFCRGVNWFNLEINKLTERERNLLYTPPSEKEIQAGIDMFDELGTYLQFRKLAKSLNKTIEQIREMKYQDCFLELYTQKLENDFNTNLSKIK
jgi:hypothetical protein